jgi:hypothetical protein
VLADEAMAAGIDHEATLAPASALADRVFPAFAAYRETAARAGRRIPIVQPVPC